MRKFDVIALVVLLILFITESIIILVEKRNKNLFKDIGANITIGLWLVLVGLVIKGIQFSLYTALYSFAPFKPDPHWWLWVVAFFSCDFIHYVYHSLGHKTRIFWAAHVTHHSSEHFNLSIAWRTNFIHLFYRFLFWAPLCLLGIPPIMILLLESITAIHNFLIHTEKIGKLGVLDRFFNTPSNHRVHHGTNPEYIDKNLGGLLMIFDHLFGTYARETFPADYGITHNINTHNPVTIILHEYKSMAKELPKIKGVSKKLRYIFSPPV